MSIARSWRGDLPQAVIFDASGVLEVDLTERRPFFGGQKSGTQGGIANVATAHLEAVGEAAEVDVRLQRGLSRKHRVPQLLSLVGGGDLEAKMKRETALEGRVDIRFVIRREEADALEALHALEQIVRLQVRVAIIRATDVGAFAEERVRLVEQQDRVPGLCRIEHVTELLLGLADELRGDLGHVYLIELKTQLLRDQGGDHRRDRSNFRADARVHCASQAL